VGKAITVAKQVCEGLAEAHELGVVHRDLKPSNIMIDKEGNARIMDFGIARSITGKGITGAGVMIGTPEYMSPEQAEGKEVDQRSDIYSLGVVLYEMVTGRVPFEGDTPFTIGVKHKSETPKDPKELNHQIPDTLSRTILKCLEKDKEARYQGAEGVLCELTDTEKGIPASEKITLGEKSSSSKKLILPALIVTAIAIIGLFLWRPWATDSTQFPDQPSIAILPFEDLSPQKNQKHLSIGLAETLINSLINIKGLRVPARTSAFFFKDKERDYQEIGKRLNVRTVLEGSIQLSGSRLRITIRLIDVSNESLIWSEQYDRDFNDVFAIQDDISFKIVDKLKLNLLEDDKAALAKRDTNNIQAYEFYLKGRTLFYNYEMLKNRQAIEMFNKALEYDPFFSLAYSGLSKCYSIQRMQWSTDDDLLVLAENAAKKAIELDDRSAEAHFALGYVYETNNSYEEMEHQMKLVLELNPNHSHAHDSLGDVLNEKGNLEEALREHKLALMIDPLFLPSLWSTADVRMKLGQYRAAKEILLRSLEIKEKNTVGMRILGQVNMLEGKYEQAVKLLEQVVKESPGTIRANVLLGLTYALTGRYKDAKDQADHIVEISRIPPEKNDLYLYLLGRIFLKQKELQSALEYFRKALKTEQSKYGVPYLVVHGGIAETHFRQGNFKEAIKEYNKISDSPIYRLNTYNFWATRHYMIAKAYERLNESDKAREEYEKFLDLWKDADPDIAEVEDAKKRLAGLKE
jgi:serine/threonine protein kinase/Tfp pilus assembly protein PilF